MPECNFPLPPKFQPNPNAAGVAHKNVDNCVYMSNTVNGNVHKRK